ncbi:MAG: TauD/TfdA family dioxygenase [Actinomycetota bacterium]
MAITDVTGGPVSERPASSLSVAERVRTCDDGVVVDDRVLSWRWLRDHATDPASFDARATQRLTPPDVVAAASAGRVDVDAAGGRVIVAWHDGAVADLAVADLLTLGDATVAVASGRADAIAWDAVGMRSRHRTLGHADLVADDHGRRTALTYFWEDGFVHLTGVPIDHAATRGAIECFGGVRSSIFGDLWEFGNDGDLDDLASTPSEITPHTDGTYSHDAPGVLALHCHEYEAEGGGNVLVDGVYLAERLRRESPDLHDVMRTVEVPGRYVGDDAHLVARRPPLRYVGDRFEQISYNHHDRAPFWHPEPLMTRVFDGLAAIDRIAADPAAQFEVDLRPGDMILLDNWRILHGRRAFRGQRRMAGGYVNREDVESTWRRLSVDADLDV